MKKYIVRVMHILCVFLLLSACADELTTQEHAAIREGVPVTVNLNLGVASSKIITRAAASDEAENTVNSVYVFAFNYDGSLDNKQIFTPSTYIMQDDCIEISFSMHSGSNKRIYAIGNPIGYEFRQTVTSGIISALNRTIKIDESEQVSYISDLIQTDATINPGNSGGPLVNSVGEVVGINTVKITSAEGIGFAIPINVVKPVVESFKEKGSFEEATLGIYAYDSDVAEYLNLKNKTNKGVYVSQIIANGPASNSGLQEGDLISSIDSNSLNTINDLREYIYSKLPGDVVKLEVIRNEKKLEIEVTLGKG